MTEQERTEARLQQECIMWAWNTLPETRGLIFAVNNNSSNRIQGALNRAKGVVAGVSDLIFLWHKTAYFIEMKTLTGTQSKRQVEFQERVLLAGYKYFIIRTLPQFQFLIKTLIQL